MSLLILVYERIETSKKVFECSFVDNFMDQTDKRQMNDTFEAKITSRRHIWKLKWLTQDAFEDVSVILYI